MVDHTCPVMRAQDLGLLADSPVTPAWCLSSWREVIAALDPVTATDPRLLLWDDGALSVYYAPRDWVNTTAKVMLVGITPGAYQAAEALREAQACLHAGYSSEETLRRADAVGSFSGPMPVLRSLVRASLGTRVAMTPGALVIPLGKAAQAAVSLLAADGLLEPGRSLTGFPHPSGGNGHRVRQYAANREALAGQVTRWAATTLS
jgi:hypothetical protein